VGALLDQALACSRSALASGALVPLATEPVPWPSWSPFQVRRLLSRTPKHLRSPGPRPNPFLPWEPDLEVQRLGQCHLLLLNKYPVQHGHVLLITQQWKPQAGWLEPSDWQALQTVESDTGGLWFFNSCAAAGASQPHRHLQLLPREPGEPSCPLAPQLLEQLSGARAPWPWRYALSPRQGSGGPDAAQELAHLYRQHCDQLGLGDPHREPAPAAPYNLLFDRSWFLTILRSREHWAGTSVNALGFAGYLLITEASDQRWLLQNRPEALLEAVAVPTI
jgi:ATP adenylyltransferase